MRIIAKSPVTACKGSVFPTFAEAICDIKAVPNVSAQSPNKKKIMCHNFNVRCILSAQVPIE